MSNIGLPLVGPWRAKARILREKVEKVFKGLDLLHAALVTAGAPDADMAAFCALRISAMPAFTYVMHNMHHAVTEKAAEIADKLGLERAGKWTGLYALAHYKAHAAEGIPRTA